MVYELLTLAKRNTAQKMKFYIMDFFSKCDEIRSILWTWSHLLKKSLMENFIFLFSERIWFNELLDWQPGNYLYIVYYSRWLSIIIICLSLCN